MYETTPYMEVPASFCEKTSVSEPHMTVEYLIDVATEHPRDQSSIDAYYDKRDQINAHFAIRRFSD